MTELFSVLVPLYRTRGDHFRQMVDSVIGQTDGAWQLVLVDDGSDDEELTSVLAEVAASDPRITVLSLDHNGGIAAASAAGLAAARGEFVALLDHDDLLAPRALEWMRAAVERFPTADVVYTDEDQLHDDGVLRNTFRKPAFSPERLRGQNYLGHLTAVRRSLLEEVGGFRPGFDGSQDYDLVLRATERARTVVHVPQVAYHWRIHDASVSHRADNAPVFESARRALAEHLDRTGTRGLVEQVHAVGVYRVRPVEPASERISVVIPTRGTSSVVRGAERVMVVEAVRTLLERSGAHDLRVVVVADSSTPASVVEELRALLPGKLRVLDYPRPFDYSEKVNLGVLHTDTELVLLLNDDTEVVEPGWLDAMVALMGPDVGMVGAELRYEDGTVQHLGLHVGDGHVRHLAEGVPNGQTGPFAAHLVAREVSGVTGACALVRRSVFDAVGGLSSTLPVNFNDVDLGFKMLDAGVRILVTPDAVLHHFESRTRRRGVTATEVGAFRRRWAHRLRSDDFWRDDVPAREMVAMSPPREGTTTWTRESA